MLCHHCEVEKTRSNNVMMALHRLIPILFEHTPGKCSVKYVHVFNLDKFYEIKVKKLVNF